MESIHPKLQVLTIDMESRTKAKALVESIDVLPSSYQGSNCQYYCIPVKEAVREDHLDADNTPFQSTRSVHPCLFPMNT